MATRAKSGRAQRAQRLLLWFVGAVLLLAAGGYVALAAVGGWAGAHPQRLADGVGRLLQQPVTIARADFTWEGVRPTLHLQGVRMGPDEAGTGKPTGEPTGAPIGRAPEQSLRLARLEIGLRRLPGMDGALVLVAHGVELDVLRDADGHWHFAGFELAPGGPPVLLRRWLARIGELRLTDAALRWRDGATAAALPFHLDELTWLPAAEGQRVALQAALPSALGGAFAAQASVRLPSVADARLPPVWHWLTRVFVRADPLQLAPAAEVLGLRLPLGQGTARLALTGSLADGRLRGLQGDIALDDLQALPWGPAAAPRGPAAAPPRLDQVAAAIDWQGDAQDWSLTAAGLTLRTPNGPWPAQDIELARRTGADGNCRWQAAFAYLRLQDLQPWLVQYGLAPAQRSQLARLAPQGELKQVRVALDHGDAGLELHTASARFAALGWQPAGRWPGINGLSGQLMGGEGQIEIKLASEDVRYAQPALFRFPIVLESLRGPVQVSSTAAGWRVDLPQLEMSSPDLQAAVHGSLEFPAADSPRLALDGRFDRGSSAAVHRYLPVGIMSERTVAWLDSALGPGRIEQGEFALHGRLADFPFQRPGQPATGRFRVAFKVRDGELRFRPDWPRIEQAQARVEFQGRGLHVAGSGRLLQSELRAVAVDIADLGHAVLDVDGQGYGPHEDLLYILRETPLAARFGDAVRDFGGAGEVGLQLHLALPLYRNPAEKTRVEGSVAFHEASLRHEPLGLALTDIDGTLDFGERVQAKNLSARLLGNPLSIDVHGSMNKKAGNKNSGGENSGGIEIEVSGRLDTATLAQRFAHPLWPHIAGSTAFDASLRLPAQGSGEPLRLYAHSALTGLAVRLPAPLAKDAAQARTLDVQLTVGKEMTELGISWGDAADALFRYAGGPRKLAFERGEIRLGGDPAILPDRPGLTVSGRLGEVDLAQFQSQETGGTAAPGRRLPELRADLQLASLRLGRIRLAPATIQWQAPIETGAEPDSGAAAKTDMGELRIDSPILAGSARLPLAADDGTPWRIRLDRLDLPASNGQPGADAKAKATATPAEPASGQPSATQWNPARWPPLDVTVDTLSRGGQALGRANMRTQPTDQGLRIETLQLTADRLKVEAQGEWTATPARTELKLTLESETLEGLLDRLGFDAGIAQGRTQAEAEFTWPGPPFAPRIAELDGRLLFTIDAGRLTEIEPGAGRVFGLLNLHALPRRLSLDFSDLFRKGFSFDQIRGDFRLVDGNAYADSMLIEAPSADIRIQGRVGLAARDYDQTATMTPHIAASVPLAGALAHPAVGAALFLAQRLYEDEINRMARYVYRVRGSWDQPQIERVNGARKPALAED